MKQIAWAIVGDGKFGFKHFGETFDTNTTYWQNRGYIAVPVYVEMTEELNEFYNLDENSFS